MTITMQMHLVCKALKDRHDVEIRLDPVLDDNLRQDYVVTNLINNVNFLEETLGFRPKFVCSPYGKATAELIAAVETAGFIVTEQMVDSADYQSGAMADGIVSAFEMQLGNSSGGAYSFISVQRDIVRNAVLVVLQIFLVAQRYGYKVVTLSDYLNPAQ